MFASKQADTMPSGGNGESPPAGIVGQSGDCLTTHHGEWRRMSQTGVTHNADSMTVASPRSCWPQGYSPAMTRDGMALNPTEDIENTVGKHAHSRWKRHDASADKHAGTVTIRSIR